MANKGLSNFTALFKLMNYIFKSKNPVGAISCGMLRKRESPLQWSIQMKTAVSLEKVPAFPLKQRK
ncbi:MAG: hypothetical protein F6K40_31010 [Okeania sp. SIO3I5]|nr:hypothetical protein [Okeania sp. SIO3I5]